MTDRSQNLDAASPSMRRVLRSIPLEDQMEQATNAIQVLDATLDGIGVREVGADEVRALHQLAIALHKLQADAADQRNRALVALSGSMRVGEIARRCGVGRSYLSRLLSRAKS